MLKIQEIQFTKLTSQFHLWYKKANKAMLKLANSQKIIKLTFLISFANYVTYITKARLHIIMH